ncbi:MAG: hypothetical protein R6X20_01615 [Phycisphaerae bacterium]
MTYVTIHAAWMLLAVAVGTVSGYLGLVRATQGEGGRSPLPGRFHLRLHQWTGAAYYAMLLVGIVGGLLMARFILGEWGGFWEWHGRLAILIAVVYAAGAWLGIGLLRHPAGTARARPIAHMVLNFTACTLVAVQIAVAVYYVWIL